MLNKIGDVELGYAPVIAAVLNRLSMDAVARADASGAAIIELRIDLLEPEERSVERVKEFLTTLRLTMPVIVTNRRREEGGSFTGTEDERIGILRGVVSTGLVDAVDIEFLADGRDEIIEEAKKHRIPVILSFHDFYGMPAPDELLELIDGMYKAGGSIAKVAVTPRTAHDALNLLQLTHRVSSNGQPLITIGMGDWGRHLRVIAPLYGSVLTYGFIEDEPVAPGQFSVRELSDMLAKLKSLRQ